MATCFGPLVWFPVLGPDESEHGAVLECDTCGYLIATGSVNDTAHTDTPVLREGLAP